MGDIAVIKDQWGTTGRIHAADPATARPRPHEPSMDTYRSRCGLKHMFGSTRNGSFSREPDPFLQALPIQRCARCERSVVGPLMSAAQAASSALLQVYELGYDRLTPTEREAISTVRHVCHGIEDGER